MPRFSEEILKSWTKPASNSEEQKLSNSISMVKDAIQKNPKLNSLDIEIFGQGSYANNTNVRLNSDIDINIRFKGGFYSDLPSNKTKKDFGLIYPINYTYSEFKNDVENALIDKFGIERVNRNNKCITIKANTYIVETDVVPTWDNRRYSENGSYVSGVAFWDDNGNKITNYPKQHIENGIEKNNLTERKYKRLTRLFRKLRYKMIEERIEVSDNITSFLLECLIWNVPNKIILDSFTWNELLKNSIVYIFKQTKEDGNSNEWGEVSELLYLFYDERKWTKSDVNYFMIQLWNYLEY
ncbi:nucleotidyltransferase domain-containing protein [Arcobacter aquimarinus]|uniref:nucleotidyltransferase domain-containing protein n=1 Tax=Arcobacter aquimarinus TaxID=1315211 RepID=UPI003BB1D357